MFFLSVSALLPQTSGGGRVFLSSFSNKSFCASPGQFPTSAFLPFSHSLSAGARANSKGALPESNFETLSRSPKVSSSLDLSLSLVPSIGAARTRNHFHTFYSSALPLEEVQAGPGPFPPSESFYLSLLSSLCLLLLSSAIFHNIKNHPEQILFPNYILKTYTAPSCDVNMCKYHFKSRSPRDNIISIHIKLVCQSLFPPLVLFRHIFFLFACFVTRVYAFEANNTVVGHEKQLPRSKIFSPLWCNS